MLQRARPPSRPGGTAGLASELQQEGVRSLHFEESLWLAAGSFNFDHFAIRICFGSRPAEAGFKFRISILSIQATYSRSGNGRHFWDETPAGCSIRAVCGTPAWRSRSSRRRFSSSVSSQSTRSPSSRSARATCYDRGYGRRSLRVGGPTSRKPGVLGCWPCDAALRSAVGSIRRSVGRLPGRTAIFAVWRRRLVHNAGYRSSRLKEPISAMGICS